MSPGERGFPTEDSVGNLREVHTAVFSTTTSNCRTDDLRGRSSGREPQIS